MTVILVTGVSANNNREKDRAALERYLGQPVFLFDPERYMDHSAVAKLVSINRLLDKAYDVLDYAFIKIEAPEINKHFKNMVTKYQPTEIWGHSLGSVIAASNKVTVNKLVTLGSPLWMPFIWPTTLIRAKNWLNYYSDREWIGRWPLAKADNFKLHCGHQLTEYLGELSHENTGLT